MGKIIKEATEVDLRIMTKISPIYTKLLAKIIIF
jgi:hypothetical protein